MQISCSQKSENVPTENTQTSTETMVTVAYPSDTVKLDEDIKLNATATYLLTSGVKANTTGYITAMSIKPLDKVKRGQKLFVLQTKEARALGNTINQLDKSFRFSGVTSVISPSSGYVQMLNHQIGDYVQDGEILATIADDNSFGFVMNVPYEYNQLVQLGKILTVQLPDGRNLPGKVSKIMPTVSPTAQTEQVLVKISDKNIPENLIANIILVKSNAKGLCVPKSAILTDDAQSELWVMKVINNNTVVKTPINKGLENNRWVEIKSGNITLKDRIVTNGNFGLADTAKVKIQK
ncbi:MAG: efflux RND transporter periplasmic adaptor subunit [Bacteroidetes bacterium]|nr:efflux RND transporter periplasmic adaptor subunit [Bacteroidota bacterium]